MTTPKPQITRGDPGIIMPVRLINQAGVFLQQLHIGSADLSEERIAEAACQTTKLSDFGDASFRRINRFILKTVEAEGALNLSGQWGYRAEFLRLSQNRLRFVDTVKRYPEILAEPIERPLFVVSFPRTGTTLLHRLLTQDPDTQFPLMWQLLHPTPATVSQEEIDGYIKSTQKFIDYSYFCVPKWRTLHKLEAQGAEECLYMLTNNYGYYVTSESATYRDWFLQRDSVPDYEYYRQEIQLLQWRRSRRRWIFKFPGHLWKLDALLKVFPDAAIVQTHRHPKEMFASWCSLVSTMRLASSNNMNVKHTARLWLDMMKLGFRRALDVRQQHPANFYDVNYKALMADPIGTIRQLYDQFGYAFTPTVEAAIRTWSQDNLYQKYGAHQYSLEQVGLDEVTIRREFADYIDAFHLEN